MAEAIRFDGPCPFLMCLEQESHEHEICQDCGAVCHGNITCATCRGYHSIDIPALDGLPTVPPL